mgnify:CR=1 FL=1
MLKQLIKLPIKLALLPLKIALKAAGILGDDTPAAPSTPPSSSTYSPPPEPEEPDDLEITAADIKDREDIVFVDVRESRELAASGTIPGAIHIPLRDVPRRYSELDKDATIVMYCAAGMRSHGAAMFLREQGYDKSHSLVQGLPAWTAAGGEVARD